MAASRRRIARTTKRPRAWTAPKRTVFSAEIRRPLEPHVHFTRWPPTSSSANTTRAGAPTSPPRQRDSSPRDASERALPFRRHHDSTDRPATASRRDTTADRSYWRRAPPRSAPNWHPRYGTWRKRRCALAGRADIGALDTCWEETGGSDDAWARTCRRPKQDQRYVTTGPGEPYEVIVADQLTVSPSPSWRVGRSITARRARAQPAETKSAATRTPAFRRERALEVLASIPWARRLESV